MQAEECDEPGLEWGSTVFRNWENKAAQEEMRSDTESQGKTSFTMREGRGQSGMWAED